MGQQKADNKGIRWMSLFLVYVLFSQELVSFSYGCARLTGTEKVMLHSGVKVQKSMVVKKAEQLASLKDVQRTQGVAVATSGPGQAETSGFSLTSTDGMVDKFTGDFSYTLPLMDIEGYPLVLKYNSNVGMNSEASWVGLGWDLNVGAVSREMRGIPDEFNGTQEIVRTLHEKADETTNGYKFGLFVGGGREMKLPGFKGTFLPSVQLTSSFGGYENTILGYGKTFDFGLQARASLVSKDERMSLGAGLGLGYSRDSKNGVGISKNIGITGSISQKDDGQGLNAGGGITFGNNFNSRSGLMTKSFGYDAGGGYSNDYIKRGSKDALGMISSGFSGGISITSIATYGTQTFIPRLSKSSLFRSTSMGYTASVDFVTGNNWKISVGLLTQTYNTENREGGGTTQINQPAYGYFHSGKRKNNTTDGKYPMMDYNRTYDPSFSEEMKNLSFSVQTYDLFYVNGMGMSSSFRARRNDYGGYYDPNFSQQTNGKTSGEVNWPDAGSVEAGLEIKGRELKLYVGGSAGYNPGELESDVLTYNEGENLLEFSDQVNGNGFDNTVYFKAIGESTPEAMDAFNAMNGTTADAFGLVKEAKEIKLGNTLLNKQTAINRDDLNNLNSTAIARPYCATQFVPKTVSDFSTSDAYYSYNPVGSSGDSTILRNSGVRDDNHLSAMEVVSTDGTRYNYGIPVYTLQNQEVSFASAGLSEVLGQPGLINYTAGTHNSTSNNLGWVGYYDKTVMPAYAHSFLLTEMFSSDYVDRSGNGPSLDDVGAYYKFNYSRIYSESNPYKWRFPFSGGSNPEAMNSKNLLGTQRDDMAHYTYGEKEIWYTHSIESKNLIAEFVLEDRSDAYAVSGENGVIDESKPLKLLKKIVLYNRSEKLANPTTAIPLQTVEFEYDYSLCKKNPSNKYTYAGSGEEYRSGKLTLKKVLFYGGTSVEMGRRYYSFSYDSINPNFSYAAVDGWGNYKPYDSNRPGDLYPYAEQNRTTADANASAYKLKAIDNPLGGRTEISYQADSYGYVQNKRVMRYMDVAGMTNLLELLAARDQGVWSTANQSTSFTSDYTTAQILSKLGLSSGSWADVSNQLFGAASTLFYFSQFGRFDKDFVPNNVILFNLDTDLVPGTLTMAQADQKVKEAYFKNSSFESGSMYLDEVYFKLMTNVNSTSNKEFIPCVGQVSEDRMGLFGNLVTMNDDMKAIGVLPKVNGEANYRYGYVVLNPANSGEVEKWNSDGVDQGGFMLHPLQRMAFDYIRQNLPDVVYGSCPGCTPDLSVDNRVAVGMDMYKYMLKSDKYCPSVLSGSILRLYEGDKEKLGGNARVKQIVYRDNWNTISGEYLSSYTWNYYYTADGQSTGVASYEPKSIQDENPFYYWDTYVNYKKHFPDETKFTPMPLGDALFPIPLVGHERVRVEFDNTNVRGYSESVFYTAKDYPTLFSATAIQKESINKRNRLTGNTLDLFGFSQGFCVQTNDYHGKPRESRLYNKNNELQARTRYEYRDFSQPVTMLNRSAVAENAFISREYDMHVESKYIKNSTKMNTFGLKLKWTLLPVASPIPVPGITFAHSKREQGFCSTVLVKHINCSAVVKSIRTEYMGSHNDAENLVYDKYTGGVLVSSLTDEYNDKLYSVNYPSHWYYTTLRDRATVDKGSYSGTLSGGVLTVSSADLRNIYCEGDVLAVTGDVDAWVLQVSEHTLTLIREDGVKYPGSGSKTVALKRTNRKNRLEEMMQSIVTKYSPLSGTTFTFPTNKIISSGAITYKYRNSVRCGEPGWEDQQQRFFSNNEVELGKGLNPFLYGIKGDLVPDKQYIWQDERTNDGATGIRKDGIYASTFYPFYRFNPSASPVGWYQVWESNHPQYNVADPDHYQKWRDMGRVTVYNEYGYPLESRDPIGVYSTVLYGYNGALNIVPVAQAVNAAQQDIAFDGFEDYDYYSTFDFQNDESHFDFRSTLGTGISVQSVHRHSGLKAIKLEGTKTALVTKKIGTVSGHENCSLTEPSGITNGEFVPQECMCIKPFEPTPGDYVISVWVKEDHALDKTYYQYAVIKVYAGGTLIGTLAPSGRIIDGWQRIEGTITVPDNLTAPNNTIGIQLTNLSSNTNVYFDDLRVHPVLAGMTTIVYDPATLLPMATHDGYNFTTFYGYDENLNQVRLRVETERGIQTVSEGEVGY